MSRTAAIFSGAMVVLGRRWWLRHSHPLRNSLCQNLSCVFDSVDFPYCARNLRQISLGQTFSLVRSFITTRCAVVIDTSLSLIFDSTNWGEGRVPTLHHNTSEGHYPIVLIRWLHLTEVCLYLIYLRTSRRKTEITYNPQSLCPFVK